MTILIRLPLVISLLVPIHIFAQNEELFVLPRLTGPVQLDGLSNDPAWEAIEPLPITMHQPVFGGEPTEKTEIRIAYDDEYFYVSGRLYDSEPDGIRVIDLERDGSSMGNDWFGIILDTFNDNENALGFWTNPAGLRTDISIFNDAEGQSPFNMSWNTFWDVAVQVNNEGWFAEIRIPFSSLRFQERDGEVVMGLIALRSIARKNEFLTYPSIPPKWTYSFNKPSVAQDVVLENVRSRNPLYITPYLLGGMDQLHQLNEAGTAYDLASEPNRDLGLDIKYGLTSNLSLDLTLNTDFAQVEVDDPQINLTRFSLFFPEKRLFFQERSGVFNFSFGGPTQFFYSRRIGLYDIGDYDYRPVPIQGGVRLVGRIRTWDMGLLGMQTAGAEFSVTDDVADSTVRVPAENFGVLRLRRQVFNPYSYAGMMLTSRIGQDGRHNYGVGVDGSIRIVGDNYLLFNVAQTMDSETESASLPDANRIRLSWEDRSLEGFSYDLFFARRGPSYIPGIGFEIYEDYFVLARRLAYAWLPGEESDAFRHTMALEFYFLFQNAERTLESAELGPAWTYEGKNGSFAQVWTKGRFESLHDTLDLPEDVFVPPERYAFYELGGMYQMPEGKLLRSGFNVSAGQFYDGLYLTAGLTPAWTISQHLTLRASYQPTWALFSERDQAFMSHLVWLRANAALNTQLSTSAFVQYNSAVDAVGINIRFRYNPREGTDFYLVYNEGLNTDRHREAPVLPVSDARSVLLKYSTTFLPW
ncbi:MAG: DUF5916 domain-containing protein [Candidatus Neomarinimicrobiota bacterium]